MSTSTEQPDDRGTENAGQDMRLPGSVAEIMASPAGPQIGAFFDLDGTLIDTVYGHVLARPLTGLDLSLGRGNRLTPTTARSSPAAPARELRWRDGPPP